MRETFIVWSALALVAGLAWAGEAPWDAALSGSNTVEAGADPAVAVSVTNRGNQPLACQVSFRLQRNPQGEELAGARAPVP